MFRFLKISPIFVSSIKQKLCKMKIVSKATNTNNSRVTIEFYGENGLLSIAEEIAKKHNCGFSHNVKIGPFMGQGIARKSFGTVSFNKGDHAGALNEFLR